MIQLRTRPTLALCAAVAWAAGCASPPPMLFVDVISDFEPACGARAGCTGEFDTVRVEVLSADGTMLAQRERRVGPEWAEEPREFLRGVRLAELAGLPTGPLQLRTYLRLGERTTAVSPRIDLTYASPAQSVTVWMMRCRRGAPCPEGTICIGTTCQPPECTPETPEACTEPLCADDSECTEHDRGECGRGRCLRGVCGVASEDEACASGFVCSTELVCVPDASTIEDAGIPDAPAACALVEACNAADDDCDGLVDEGFDLSGDPQNCGACGNVCELAHAWSHCIAGSCEIMSCRMGWRSCNGITEDGCEGLIGSGEHCMGCNRGCEADQVCVSAACVCAPGTLDCDAVVGCETAQSSASCGACGVSCGPGETCDVATGRCRCGGTYGTAGAGRACVLPNATATCSAGACAIASCAGSYRDCNGVAADGCEQGEPFVCEACGVSCPTGVHVATWGCTSGFSCLAAACEMGWYHCDTSHANGCESTSPCP